MRECFDLDELVALSGVMKPDVDVALAHLQGCSTCRENVHTLAAVRAALSETNPVDESTLAKVTSALRAERRREGALVRLPWWALAVEAVLAGLTGPMLMYSSGVSADLSSAVVLALICAAAVVISRRIERPSSAAARA